MSVVTVDSDRNKQKTLPPASSAPAPPESSTDGLKDTGAIPKAKPPVVSQAVGVQSQSQGKTPRDEFRHYMDVWGRDICVSHDAQSG